MLAFSRAITGLKIAEQNLYVTSNNLSNVETEGYHRQRLNQYAFRTTSKGDFQIGLGVDADTLRQVRCEFLETNYRNELASFGEYKYESKVYDSIQSIVGNNGSSVQDCITDLWESFNELTKEYTTTVAGGYLRENAVSLVAELDSINQQLDKMQNELDVEVRNTVKKINDYATQIAQLNDQINRSESNGSLACELRDSRDSVIAELSELIEIDVEQATNTCVNIRTGNGYLVVRTNVNKLTTDQITPRSTFCSPVWEKTGIPLEVTSGALKGILDMRGGDVVGNLEHSTNGAPKEKMDVVVSFDTNMSHSTLEGMYSNLSNMLDVLDRQDANYQLYLTDGTKVSKTELQEFMKYLYSESVKLEIDNYTGTTISGLQENLDNLYGSNSQISSDIWSYIESRGANINDFFAYVNANEADLDKLNNMQEQMDKYLLDGGTTLKGFMDYLSENNVSDELINSLKNHMNNYVDNTVIYDALDIKTFIDNTYDTTTLLPNMLTANTENVLGNIRQATIIDFRDDSNKYMLVFTDNNVGNNVIKEDIQAIMNEIDMRLLAVTDEDSKISWRELVQGTDGNVFDISGFSTEDGTEDIALSLTRDFNSRLIGADEECGISFFRAGLNSLLNVLVKEINGIFRQGQNTYGNRHGEVMTDENGNIIYDDETGDPKYHNLDLFVKIDEKLPFQMENIKINPVFTDLNKMPLSLTGETGDFQIGNMLVDLISTDIFNSGDNYSTLDEYYADFILDFGQAANIATSGYEQQSTVLTTAKERIQTVSSVSMDEELSNMIKFQYSYTAASKMINVINEMLETIVNM